MEEGKKFYLTKKGLSKTKKDYETLKVLRIAKTNGEIPRVLESEDLNPEYVSFQEDLAFMETKLIELETIIKNAVVINPPKIDKDIIQMGAKVSLEIDGEANDEFVIVGSQEANPSLGKISNESPVGRALLGRKVGEIIVLSSPIKTSYKIKKIKYA